MVYRLFYLGGVVLQARIQVAIVDIIIIDVGASVIACDPGIVVVVRLGKPLPSIAFILSAFHRRVRPKARTPIFQIFRDCGCSTSAVSAMKAVISLHSPRRRSRRRLWQDDYSIGGGETSRESGGLSSPIVHQR